MAEAGIDRANWVNHIESFPQDSEYLKQSFYDCQTVCSLLQHKIEYDTTSVRIH